jgi:HAD superfamily hydrolase (TIGR01509 family)
MIKLIIFDLDGVLVDMKDVHYEALNNALRKHSSSFCISYQEHLSTYDGMKTLDKLKLLTHHKNLPSHLYEEIWTDKQHQTIEYIKQLKSSSVILETLRSLKEQGYTLAVASNSIRDTVKNALYYSRYIEHIDFYYTNDDVHLAKPNAEIYLKCMISAKASPKETVILEDSPIGIQGAESTGASVIHIKNTKDINPSLVTHILNMNQNSTKNKWKNNKLNIVIPMAGAGSRFEKAGYTFPKPLIDVNGEPMIKTVIDNLNIDAHYIFIVQKQHYEKYNLKHLLNLIAPNCSIVPTEGLTEGAACTVLLSKHLIDNDNPLLIANSDQYVEWNSTDFMYTMENSQTDGGILTFESTHPKWSFAKLDSEGFVTEVAEKKPISNIATVGIYYWTHGNDFVKYAEQMISNNNRVNNEFYVCPVYNEAIKDNKKIRIYNIEKMWGLGTPEDLDIFLNRK